MESHVLHTVWCNIAGGAAGEFWHWSLSGVKGLTFWVVLVVCRDAEEGEPYSKKELIDLAKQIATESREVVKHARKVADQCSDKRLKQVQDDYTAGDDDHLQPLMVNVVNGMLKW